MNTPIHSAGVPPPSCTARRERFEGLRRWVAPFFLLVFLMPGRGLADPVDVTLQWDANVGPGLATGTDPRYQIYYRIDASLGGDKANADAVVQISGDEADAMADPYVVEYTITGLDDAYVYYFGVDAWNDRGMAGGLSHEVSTENPMHPAISIFEINGKSREDPVLTNTPDRLVTIRITAFDDTRLTHYLVQDGNSVPDAGNLQEIPGGPLQSDGEEVSFEVVDDANFPLNDLDGSRTLYAWVMDDGGYLNSVPASKWNVTLDRNALPPGSLDLDNADDTGFTDLDNITARSEGLSISGTGENGAAVQLYDNEVPVENAVGEVTAGLFSIDISLDEGIHGITALQTDPTGNVSEMSEVLTILVDTTALAPSGLDLDEADDSGASANDNLTNKTTGLTITGSGEYRAVVQLYDGDDPIPGAVGTVPGGFGPGTPIGEGIFSIDITLAEGSHSIRAVQADVAGNISAASDALAITVDSIAAAPTGLDLSDGDDTGSNSDNVTSQTTGLTISGSAENGAWVQLYDGGEPVAGGSSVESNGRFSIDIDLSAGEHIITAVQTDAAGNISAGSEPILIQVDTTWPQLTGAFYVDATHVDVKFSEAIAGGTLAENYTMTGAVTVDGAEKCGEDFFRLLTSPMETGGTYTVSIAGTATDIAGNTIDPSASSTDFTASPAAAGDINGDGVINLPDAILAARLLSNLQPICVHRAADVNGDGVVGFEEMIFILQTMGSTR